MKPYEIATLASDELRRRLIQHGLGPAQAERYIRLRDEPETLDIMSRLLERNTR